MNTKIRIVQSAFILWAFLIFGRLAYWQVIKASELQSQAQKQYQASDIIPAPRGEIFASDNFPLASNEQTYNLIVDKVQLEKDPVSVQTLFDNLPSTSSAKNIFNDATGNWLIIARNLSQDQYEHINNLKLSGIGFDTELKRIYPEGSPSAYLTGFVGNNETGESQGYFGLEGQYDRMLRGKPGKRFMQKDARGNPILIESQEIIPSQPGSSLHTSIDRTVQFLAVQKLKEGLEKYQAVSGTVSIMESKTGKILAMVSLPGYDPNNFSQYLTSQYKNPIISESYEPGSTFKTVVMASALDAEVVSPDTVCTACSGPVTISDATVGSWNGQYYPESTMKDVILHSDNVGMVFVSRKLGKTRMLEYFRKFGLGKLTGIDLQEEASPELRPDKEWYDIDWATAAFGQGIALTRIQMLTAVNVLANNGMLIKPRVVTAISRGTEKSEISAPDPIRVIETKAAAQIVMMMVNGVNSGEVRYYKPQGFSIAGKTGTAQVPISGHYDKDKVIASFVGFAPAENPKFTMLVTLREPKSSPWGSTTAAPLWFEIAKELFRYYKILPTVSTGL
jgi:cell division protein FtsI/penicillin-binding protein 2